jgi:hypothetical protein
MIEFKCQVLIVYGIYNGTNKAQASRKKVEYPHADLIGEKAMYARKAQETNQTGKQNKLGIFAPGAVDACESLSLFVTKIFDQCLDVIKLNALNFGKMK